MTITLARKVDGKKYLWDGLVYESQDQAQQALEAYQQEGFEVQMFAEDNQYLVYSRRVVTVQSGS